MLLSTVGVQQQRSVELPAVVQLSGTPPRCSAHIPANAGWCSVTCRLVPPLVGPESGCTANCSWVSSVIADLTELEPGAMAVVVLGEAAVRVSA